MFRRSDTQSAGAVLYSPCDRSQKQGRKPAQPNEATAGNHCGRNLPILWSHDVGTSWSNPVLASEDTGENAGAEPESLQTLAPSGTAVGQLFLLLRTTMVAAGVGWFRGRYWGWVLAVVIIATQVLVDLINLLRGDILRGGLGFVIAGARLAYLLSSQVRTFFSDLRTSIH